MPTNSTPKKPNSKKCDMNLRKVKISSSIQKEGSFSQCAKANQNTLRVWRSKKRASFWNLTRFEKCPTIVPFEFMNNRFHIFWTGTRERPLQHLKRFKITLLPTAVISNLFPRKLGNINHLKIFDLLAINNSCYSSIVYFFGVTNLLFSKRHLIYIFWRRKKIAY